MKLVMQPPNSSLCGQACVATVAGVSLEESINAFGTRGATAYHHLIDSLNALGVDCGDKMVRLNKGVDKPDLCIVLFHFKESTKTHWVVFTRYKNLHGKTREFYLDPSHGVHLGYPCGCDQAWETSFLPIYKECSPIVDSEIAPWWGYQLRASRAGSE